jgi:citrate synthase
MTKLNKEHGNKVLGEVTVGQAIGGMRDIKCMVWETSLLDAQEGIRFRGHTIAELQDKLPKIKGGSEPLPEGLLWLLLTGEVPNEKQVKELTEELHSRAKLPSYVESMIRSFPKKMHPMTQLSSAILALQCESKFAAKYQEGMHKNDYWKPTLEDTLDVIAKLPEVAALIYRCTFHDGKVAAYDKT